MKSHACAVITLIVLAVCHDSLAAETTDEALKKFGRNLDVAKVYQFGQESNALVEIEQLVFTLPRDSQLRERLGAAAHRSSADPRRRRMRKISCADNCE